MSEVKPVPDGCNTVNIYLIVPNAVEAMAFYAKAFGALPGMRMPGPGGDCTMHAEMFLGNSTIMLADEYPQIGQHSALTLGGSPLSVHLYVQDADSLFEQAVTAGCTVVAPLQDMFWGDRFGKVIDPFGIQWSIATHKEDVPADELAKRAEVALAALADEGTNDSPSS